MLDIGPLFLLLSFVKVLDQHTVDQNVYTDILQVVSLCYAMLTTKVLLNRSFSRTVTLNIRAEIVKNCLWTIM